MYYYIIVCFPILFLKDQGVVNNLSKYATPNRLEFRDRKVLSNLIVIFITVINTILY